MLNWIFFIFVVMGYSNMISKLEVRTNLIQFKDPFFQYFGDAKDTSIPVNFLFYSALVLFLFSNFDHVNSCSTLPVSLSLLFIVRILCMFFLPLKADNQIKPLNDWLQKGATGATRNDLFFSGHISTIFMFYLYDRNYYYIISSFFISILFLISRAHYTIDLIVAPFISYGIFRILE